MRPTGDGWELWSLAFWWAAWSLADTYLLTFSPWSELSVIGICVLILFVAWFRERRRRHNAKPQRYSAEMVGSEERTGACDVV